MADDHVRRFKLLVSALESAGEVLHRLNEANYQPTDSQVRTILYWCEDISTHIYGGLQNHRPEE